MAAAAMKGAFGSYDQDSRSVRRSLAALRVVF